jgi:hypothetical protein
MVSLHVMGQAAELLRNRRRIDSRSWRTKNRRELMEDDREVADSLSDWGFAHSETRTSAVMA